MLRFPPTRSTSIQRRARSCPRRAPVVAARVRIEMQGGVASYELEELRYLSWRGRPHLGRLISGRSRVVGHVFEDPGPALRLGQRGMERRMDASYRANRRRVAIDSTPRAEVFVELVDDAVVSSPAKMSPRLGLR
jgi:hypothetical protein